MKKEDKKLFLAAGMIFISRITFLVGFLFFAQVALNIEASLTQAVILLAVGLPSGFIGFYLTGSSKLAWLQIPHQALAIVGVGLFFYGGLALLEGGFNLSLLALVILGPVFTVSWWYCAKYNVYKA